MKILNYLSAMALFIFFLTSCAHLNQVVDDDVYVTKNPKISSTEEVNDETSYENYRFRRDRGDFNTHYRIASTFSHFPLSYNSYFRGTYSAFNDPFYYPNQYGKVYGNAMFFQFGNFGTYYYNSLYNNNFWYYNQGYNVNNYNYVYYPIKPTSFNTHNGPRYAYSGLNNYGRRLSSGYKGIQKNNSAISYRNKNEIKYNPKSNGTNRSDQVNNSSNKEISKNIKSSRQVSSGTGLSRTKSEVTSSTTVRRQNTSEQNNSAGTRTNSSSTRSSSSSTERSSEPSMGTNRNTNSGSGNITTPRSGGSSSGSSGGRRGG